MGRRLEFDVSQLPQKKLGKRARADKRLANQILARVEQMSGAQIARELGLDVKRVRNCAARHNISLKQGFFTLGRLERATGYHRTTLLKVAIRLFGEEGLPKTDRGQYRFLEHHVHRIVEFLKENSLADIAGLLWRKKLRRHPGRKKFAPGARFMGQEILSHGSETDPSGQVRLMLNCRCLRCKHTYATAMQNFAKKRSKGCKKCCMRGIAKPVSFFKAHAKEVLARLQERYPVGGPLFGRARVLDVLERRHVYSSGRGALRRYIRFRCPENDCNSIAHVDSREVTRRQYDMCPACIRVKVLYPSMRAARRGGAAEEV